ncbi:MAG: hypothetical protein KDB53_17735, partial [Planctomycetes bacterium]|nr:hypothetical protein [Planctomycetota bacterium]
TSFRVGSRQPLPAGFLKATLEREGRESRHLPITNGKGTIPDDPGLEDGAWKLVLWLETVTGPRAVATIAVQIDRAG